MEVTTGFCLGTVSTFGVKVENVIGVVLNRLGGKGGECGNLESFKFVTDLLRVKAVAISGMLMSSSSSKSFEVVLIASGFSFCGSLGGLSIDVLNFSVVGTFIAFSPSFDGLSCTTFVSDSADFCDLSKLIISGDFSVMGDFLFSNLEALMFNGVVNFTFIFKLSSAV